MNDEVDLTIDELLEFPEDELDQFVKLLPSNEVERPFPVWRRAWSSTSPRVATSTPVT